MKSFTTLFMVLHNLGGIYFYLVVMIEGAGGGFVG